ncbi:hypothetical protein KFK09_022297 [Dendrobium nobile]|uniref:Peptidase S9 prolyl oligopeptidase catalytic domain-containing protein n=1 Tax=Dendrobium nobile TaxID=94219 RepID=A0A8T3AIQ5_DENNO|nr:hypothetical protein KFK09_022297 [Dendrobium nobile]
MFSYLSALAYLVGVVAAAALALLVVFQERLVYVPVLPGLSKSYAITPARLRLAYEDVWLHSADGVRLHAWFIKIFPDCTGPTILFFQENAGNIAHRLECVRIMLQRLHCNVFLLSYRGYGASDGDPSQHGIIMDAQVSALILENTFTSVLDMAGVLLPILKWFIGGGGSKGPKVLNFLVRSPWSTIDIIGQVKQPILFLSGLQDEMVPPSHMQMLYKKAAEKNSRCLFIDFPTGMHMDTWLSGGDRYWRTIQLFLDQYVSQTKDTERRTFERKIS